MTIPQAILLGALQGLAEFLPVSSSGHLALAQHFMDLGEVPLLFDILLHLATLCSVCLVFRSRIGALLAAFVRLVAGKSYPEDAADRSMIVALLAGTAVTAVVGFLLKDAVEKLPLFWIAVSLAVTGVLLFASGRYRPRDARPVPGVPAGLAIGLAQGIGVIPGISRSGITITAALFAGVERKAAGEFSFLLSIPVILGAFILELKSADTLSGVVSAVPLAVGMAVAFAVGYLSLRFLLALINRGKLGWFALYLVPAGISLAIYFAVA